ncbi:MAG: rhomboid family intramembrane serine protease [Bacteroidales bacterium]|nr:rhomboid family intramembrane serine protease [Bacteroidales bacterium]MBR2438215.1 rhomboid family intramembrane serine protease [Bacteroidales bacterium]MBR4088118.1 rhomboid family intramembrane serine protease [Bacteroidales bacterium]
MFRGNSILGSMPPVVKNLLLVNVLMYIITMITGNFMYGNFALFYFDSPLFKPYQLVTHMFMHGGFTHILFNMYTLYIFGCVLERVWGSQKFLFYYFVTGIGAALLHMGVMWLQLQGYIADLNAGDMFARAEIEALLTTPTVGASGAIYGLLLAYGMLFPDNIMQLIFPPVALKAKWFVIIFGALELLLGLSGRGGNVAHFAHLGGMIFGFFLILYWKKNNRMYY